jgi:hypothetical protein
VLAVISAILYRELMAHAEIILGSGHPGGVIFEHSHIDGPDAIKNGYQRFKEITEERADWLLRANAKRDFEDNLVIAIDLRIGPMPFWDEDYLKEHSMGNYSYEPADPDAII